MKSSVSQRPYRARIQDMLRKKVVRYIIVGGLVYVFELWVIVVAQAKGASPTQAVATSFTLGLLVSFFLQKIVTFGDKRMHHKIVLLQAVAVGALVIWNLCFTIALTWLLQSLLPPTVTRTIALLITTVWNFYLYKTRIFTTAAPVVHVERPSFLLGTKQAPSVRLPAPLYTPHIKKHESKIASLVVVCVCIGLIASLISAATLMQSIEDNASKQKDAKIEMINDTGCAGQTIVQIVAHEDDDLLFMSPDLQKAVNAGKCIRTVYLTAGNAGMGLAYAKQREKGAQAAYATMLHENTDGWRRRFIRLNPKSSVEIAVPATDTKVSLIFYRLPDGGIRGSGYDVKGNPPRSLAGMLNGAKPSLTSIDNRGVYTKDMLITSLAQLIARYKPEEVRVQAVLPDERAADHSDHYATGWIARQAFMQFQASHSDVNTAITYYMGYPVMYREENISGEDLAAKEAAFLAYAKFDGSVCQNNDECTYGDNAYVKYLPRMYTIPESDIYSWGE